MRILISLLVISALLVPNAIRAHAATQTPNLSQIYRSDDGGALYLRAVGAVVYGFGEHPGRNYAYALHGTLQGDRIKANFWDIPKGGRQEFGEIELQVSQAGARLVRKSQGGAIGADVWTRIEPGSFPWPVRRAAGFQATTTDALNGVFRGNDGSWHYIREVDNAVVWVAEAPTQPGGRPAWVSVFLGKRDAKIFPVAGFPPQPVHVSGQFADVTKGLAGALGSFGAQIDGARNLRLFQIGAGRAQSLAPDYAVDWDAFANSIRGSLDGNAVGYAFAVGKGMGLRRSGAAGFRQLAADGQKLPFTTKTQSQAASTSKTVTAVALVKALRDRKLTVDAKVAPFLPNCWKQGPGIKSLTFRELLDHTGGLSRSGPSDPYELLRDLVAKGRVNPTDPKYNNRPYALMRYLVPLVANEVAAKAVFSAFNCANSLGSLNAQISDMFASYIFDDVLGPIDVEAAFVPTGNFALLYNRLAQHLKGWPPNPESKIRAGAGYLAISVRNYRKFLASLHEGEILPKSLVRSMYSGRLGFDSPSEGKAGTYHRKNGTCPNKSGYTCSAELMVFPSGIHAYVMVNSSIRRTPPTWYFDRNHDGKSDGTLSNWGLGDDVPVMGDFDSDGRSDDIAVFRPSTRSWYFNFNRDQKTNQTIKSWGILGDVPLAGDFDGDGRSDDIGVFRPATQEWFFDFNHDGKTDRKLTNWGKKGDLPIVGDFDRDGRIDDIAVFRPSTKEWFFDFNHDGKTDRKLTNWGKNGDRPVAGDFDRDGRNDDIALFRPSTKEWFFDHNHDGKTDEKIANWAQKGDVPLAGDIDGDGRNDDIAVTRSSSVVLKNLLKSAFDSALK